MRKQVWNEEENEEEWEEEDGFSQMSWEKDPFESDEDWQDRMADLDDFMDYYND